MAPQLRRGAGTKKRRYNGKQIVRILHEADRDTVHEVAKRHGVSEASTYAGRKRFGEMVSDDVKHLKTLEAENAELTRRSWPSVISGLRSCGKWAKKKQPRRFAVSKPASR